MQALADGRLSLLDTLRAQRRILVALMLRDVRTRFFGSAFGFLVAIGWPLSHVGILLLLNAGLGRAAPYGESAALWYATGVIPFQGFQYMSRFIMMGVILNRALLSLPIVKVTDILFARAIIEVLNAGLVVLILFGIFLALGIDFTPLDIVQASWALLAMMFLGLGFGVVNGIIGAAFPLWVTGYALLMFVFWIASGVMFVPDALPEAVRTPLSYLPMLQGVEWMRSAYYEGYGSGVLDKTYLVSFATAALFVGLALERLVRGKIRAA